MGSESVAFEIERSKLLGQLRPLRGPEHGSKCLGLEEPCARGVGLLIYGSILVINVDNVIRPRLVSGRTKVHPLLILIGVLGGLKIFGFIGMLLGPLILALLVALIRFYEHAYLPTSHVNG